MLACEITFFCGCLSLCVLVEACLFCTEDCLSLFVIVCDCLRLFVFVRVCLCWFLSVYCFGCACV